MHLAQSKRTMPQDRIAVPPWTAATLLSETSLGKINELENVKD